MILVIAGGRDFFDYDLMKAGIKTALIEWNIKPSLVISGGAQGADGMVENWADAAGIVFGAIRPDYVTYPGKIAPIMRNKEMAEAGTHLIAFWDGKSRGTKNMIEEMQVLNKPVRIFYYEA